MKAFKAFRIHERAGAIVAGFEQMDVDALTPGEVVIRVRFSSINYKDALAATGAGRILRKYPLNGGIDLSGEVVASTDARYEPGQQVLVTGCSLSETVDGGYAEVARIAGETLGQPRGGEIAPGQLNRACLGHFDLDAGGGGARHRAGGARSRVVLALHRPAQTRRQPVGIVRRPRPGDGDRGVGQ